MNKLILSSNLPAVSAPVRVVGASMQRFCNCNPKHKTKDTVPAKK